MYQDIECANRKGVFPEPEHDAVIQIANVVTVQGDSKPFIRNVFTLNSCSSIVGADVRSFDSERNMLLEWAEFLRTIDPDIITGYNTSNFDFWYLFGRAKTLKIKSEFCVISRIKRERCRIKVRAARCPCVAELHYSRIKGKLTHSTISNSRPRCPTKESVFASKAYGRRESRAPGTVSWWLDDGAQVIATLLIRSNRLLQRFVDVCKST